MNKMALAAAMAASITGSASAVAQPAADTAQLLYELTQQVDNAFYRDGGGWLLSQDAGDLSGARCTKTLAALRKAKVPGSTQIELTKDHPRLARGKHTLVAIRPLCDTIDLYAKVRAWEFWAFQAVQESARIGTGAYYDAAMFESCVRTYDQMIAAGVPSTQAVLAQDILGPRGGGKVRWSGTVQALRTKWCDIGLAQVRDEMEAKQAPYKQALEADKLAMVIPAGANAVRAFILPGGAVSRDPSQLAAAAVWFSDTRSVNTDRATCKAGQEIHTVHRYEFDQRHKLIKTTDRAYCGTVPRSAYR